MGNKNKFNVLPPRGFELPSELPQNNNEAKKWQKANKSWWENTPMKYDWNNKLEFTEGSIEYYNEVDRRLFAIHELFIPRKKLPYDAIIPYSRLKKYKVLEVGVGNGTHAEMLSKNCKSFTGIDLTEFASKATKKRFKVKKLPGAILKMDAEKMSFSNNKFDFIWSWGVIHHSSNTKEILKEIHRVLKPDGEVIIMVYHKSFWYYYIVNGLFRGVFLGKLFKLGSIHKVVQYYTDGAIARYYTENEWKDLAAGLFKIKKFLVYGQKLEILPIPYSKFKIFLANCIPSSITRLFLNKWKFGSMLVIHMTK